MNLHPRPYTTSNTEGIYFVTFTVVFWMDVFIRENYKKIFTDSLTYCIQNKGLRVHAWCLMTSHAHLIISSSEPEKYILSDIIRDLKKFTAYKIIEATNNSNESRREWMLHKFAQAATLNKRNSKYQFWIQGNHAEELLFRDFSEQKLQYIHNNPVKEGWVIKPEDYRYSSAIDYSGGKGIVQISFL